MTLSAAHNQTIYGNIILNNIYEGVEVGDSEYNLFAGNNITQNDNGLVLQGTSINNTVWMNFISNNSGVNGKDESGDNLWDNGQVGNYWGDYQNRYPLAVPSDNIWSVPYEVNGSGEESHVNDTLPLVSATSFLEIVAWDDFKYGYGQVGNEIQWVIIGDMSIMPQYRIFLNEDLIQTGNWNIEGISFNIDGLAVGTYDFKIVVTDGTAWEEIEDVVQVEVGFLPGKPVFITENQTVIFITDFSQTIIIEWEASPYAEYYGVYLNGSFLTNTEEPHLVFEFSEGNHSFYIVAWNEFGQSAPSATIVTTVKLADPDDPSNVIFFVLGGVFVLIGAGAGVFIFIKKKKTS